MPILAATESLHIPLYHTVQPGAEKDFDRVIELDSDFEGVSTTDGSKQFWSHRCPLHTTQQPTQ